MCNKQIDKKVLIIRSVKEEINGEKLLGQLRWLAGLQK